MAVDETPRGSIRISSDPDVTRVESSHREGMEHIHLPLRLLFAADLTPHSDAASIRPVDRESFASFFKDLAPRLEIEVPNQLSNAPRLLDFELTFSSLDDFRPDRLARQVPALNSLLEVRHLVARVKSKELDLNTFRAELEDLGIDPDWARDLFGVLASTPSASKKPPSEKPAGDTLDRLFSLVDAGTPEAGPNDRAVEDGSVINALMDAVMDAPRAGPRPEMAAVDVLLDDLDQTLSRQLNFILGHPWVRELESAWRGLKFLVNRLDFRGDMELDVLPVKKAEIDNALYREVLVPEHENEESRRLACIVVGFSFDSSPADVSLLEELASTASSLQVPIVGSVGPAFFGLDAERGLSKLPLLWQHLEGPQYIAWSKLRSRPEARHIALALPAFLLRPAYDRETVGFNFEEQGQLWGGAALMVAAAVAESFAETGWPTKITQYPVEDLPVWRLGSDALPLAAAFSTEKMSELAEAGFTTLSCRPGRDEVRISHEPTVGRPGKGGLLGDNASLSGQLFLARAAHFLLALQEKLPEGGSAETICADVKKRLEGILHAEGDAVTVDLVAGPDSGSPKRIRIHVQTPSAVLDPPAELMLGFPITASKGTT